MNNFANPEVCPYVGLEPFENSHREYFFGRERDIKIIADHVVARTVTVLYGPSGVGKTSIVNVGLSNQLPLLADWIIVRLRDWQDPAKLERLAVEALLKAAERRPLWTPEKSRFVPLVAWITRRSHSPILLILDQFEEYFLYRDRDRMREFEQVIGGLIARRDVPLHVLVTLRDDSVHQLDELRGAIPGILDTMIRLDHLRDEDVEDAISSPIAQYNKNFRGNQKKIVVEENLPTALIQQLKEADIGLGKGRAYNNVERRIELPYLQLALMKLWDASGGEKASVLREATLIDELGGLRQIVRSHVWLVMSGLTEDEQKVCAKIFDRLVTGIGSKVAYPTEGLAADEVVGSSTSKDDVQAVLEKLATRNARILKPVTTNEMPGFEIFHDVLALSVLEWKREFQAEIKRKENVELRAALSRRGALFFAGAVITSAIVFAFLAWLSQSFSKSSTSANKLLEPLSLYGIGVLGGIAVEFAAALRLSTQLGGGPPQIYRSPFFLLTRIAFVLFVAGPLPVLLDAPSIWAAFYYGLSAPILFDSLARGIQSDHGSKLPDQIRRDLAD